LGSSSLEPVAFTGSLSKIKHSRRIATRYDKLASSFLGFVQLATIRLWIRFVNAT